MRTRNTTRRRAQDRRGAASLDYVLILGVVLPMIMMVLVFGPQVMARVYEMLNVLVTWPFM